jgi:hypothetical protein
MVRRFYRGFGMAFAKSRGKRGLADQPAKNLEGPMSSPSNEFTYGKELVGNPSDGSQSVSARVYTRLRVTTDLTAREVQEHKGRSHCVPTYIFGHGGELPIHPSLQAQGRHYFTW